MSFNTRICLEGSKRKLETAGKSFFDRLDPPTTSGGIMPTPRESLRQDKGRPAKNSRRFSDKPEHLLSTANPQSTLPPSRSTPSIPETSSLSPAAPNRQARRPLLTKEALQRLDFENNKPKPDPPLPHLEAHMRKSKKSEKKKAKPDKNSHPLNLPPDQLRQLSAAMAGANANGDSMDVDEPQPPTSPIKTSPPVTPLQSAPGAFPDSTMNSDTNGVNGHDDEKSPTPPPHKEPPPPPVDAEACKAAGNKFFKAKDYPRAIMEYTKGTIKSGT
jgi:DnaJ family protein C protein 7